MASYYIHGLTRNQVVSNLYADNIYFTETADRIETAEETYYKDGEKITEIVVW